MGLFKKKKKVTIQTPKKVYTPKLNTSIAFSPANEKGDVKMLLSMKGELGVVELCINTSWVLPETKDVDSKPSASYLGYHSRQPLFEGHEPNDDLECDHYGYGCFYERTYIDVDKYFDAILKDGSEALWRLIESEYKKVFGRVE